MLFPEPLQVAVYLRKSRKDMEAEKSAAERGEDYDTLAKHRMELLAFAKRECFLIVDVFEEVLSGEFIRERPAMQELLRKVEANSYNAVLVADLDRLGRGDKRDQGWIEKVFKDTNTLILTPFETHDLNQEAGEFTVEVKGFLARMEYKQIKKRLLSGRRRSVLQGKDLSQKPPYGYVKDASLHLSIHPHEAIIVRQIFDWCIAGLGRSKIADTLTDRGIPSPLGHPSWSRVTVGKILKNPKYKGDQVYGRVRWIKQEDGSYITRKVHKEEDVIWKKEAHPAIITPDRWELAQRSVASRTPPAPSKTRSLINPFAGLLVCNICGKSMQASAPKNRPGAYLSCLTHRCPQRMIALKKIETVIYEQIRPLLEPLTLRAKEPLASAQQSADILRYVKNIELEMERLHRQQERICELLERGIYQEALFQVRFQQITQECTRLESEKTRMLCEHTKYINANQKEFDQAKNAWELFFKSTSEQKNRILRAFIKQIRYLRHPDWYEPYHFSLEIILQDGF